MTPYSSQLVKVENQEEWCGECGNCNAVDLLPVWNDYVDGVYVEPVCEECEEKVQEECHDIHLANKAKWDAQKAAEAAYEAADEAYEAAKA